MAEISRRTLFHRGLLLLAAASGAALAATKSVRHKVAQPPPPPPAGLVAALTTQQRLSRGYDAALAAVPAKQAILTALKADITAHGAALQAILETYPGWRLSQGGPPGATSATPTATATPTGTAEPTSSPQPPIVGSTAALAVASRQAAATASATCLGWPAADREATTIVALLGSISACLSTHAQVLS
jgi:hypothetical protein